MTQPVRRGLRPVQQSTGEGTQIAREERIIVKDVVKPRPEIIMGDEGVPNPAQFYTGRER